MDEGKKVTETKKVESAEKETVVNLSEGTGKREHNPTEFDMLVREQNSK
jgi:hypothetical protein